MTVVNRAIAAIPGVLPYLMLLAVSLLVLACSNSGGGTGY